jgi:hypothetical protein
MSAPTLGSFDDKLTQATVKAIDIVKLKIVELGNRLIQQCCFVCFFIVPFILLLFLDRQPAEKQSLIDAAKHTTESLFSVKAAVNGLLLFGIMKFVVRFVCVLF